MIWYIMAVLTVLPPIMLAVFSVGALFYLAFKK